MKYNETIINIIDQLANITRQHLNQNAISKATMKFTIACTSFLSLLLAVLVEAQNATDVTKYSFKTNSNEASLSNFWNTEPCSDYDNDWYYNSKYFNLNAYDSVYKTPGSQNDATNYFMVARISPRAVRSPAMRLATASFLVLMIRVQPTST